MDPGIWSGKVKFRGWNLMLGHASEISSLLLVLIDSGVNDHPDGE